MGFAPRRHAAHLSEETVTPRVLPPGSAFMVGTIFTWSMAGGEDAVIA